MDDDKKQNKFEFHAANPLGYHPDRCPLAPDLHEEFPYEEVFRRLDGEPEDQDSEAEQRKLMASHVNGFLRWLIGEIEDADLKTIGLRSVGAHNFIRPGETPPKLLKKFNRCMAARRGARSRAVKKAA